MLRQMDEKVVESYQAKFIKKENDKTMSMQEKLEHRDDKDLSPFSADSIGCTICDHHTEDKQYTAKISQFPIRDHQAASQATSQPSRILPQEIVAKKLGDKRNPLNEDMLSIEYNKPIEPIIRSTSPTTPEIHNDDESTSSEEDEDKKKKDEKVADFFVHIIEKGDTLVGLSLKYGVQVDVLARINFLNKSNFHQISHIKQLKIPTNGKTISPQVLRTPTKQEITNEFARKK